MKRGVVISLLLFTQAGCAISRPCTAAGDTKWRLEFQVKGDKLCYQKKNETGKWVNHGYYKHLHPNRKVALEGHFKMGRKNGVWTEYNDRGEPVLQRYFENGLEKPYMPAPDGSGESKEAKKKEPRYRRS